MDSKRSESNRELFVRVVSRKVRPFIKEEVDAEFNQPGVFADSKSTEELTDYVSKIVERLLGRFYELGAQEATMYMPLIMVAVRKADRDGM